MLGHNELRTVTLTEKQHEVMNLVAQRYSTKMIARELGIAPNSVDHRIDAVRKKLNCNTRAEAASLWIRHFDTGKSHPGVPFPVTTEPKITAEKASSDEVFTLNDSELISERAPWSVPTSSWQIPEIRPRDLGTVARLAVMIGLAIALVILVTQGLELSRSMGRMLS